MLEDLEVFMAVEVVDEEEGTKEACLARSWSPCLGSPILVAPAFSMAACQLTAPERSPERGDKEETVKYQTFELLSSRKITALICLCILCSTAEQLPGAGRQILPTQMVSIVSLKLLSFTTKPHCLCTKGTRKYC